MLKSRHIKDICKTNAIGAKSDINGSMAQNWDRGSIRKMDNAMLGISGVPWGERIKERSGIDHVVGRPTIHNKSNNSFQDSKRVVGVLGGVGG